MPPAPEQPELRFEYHLPAGQKWFSIHQLARIWGLSPQHVINLVEAGEFDAGGIAPVNHALRPKQTRSTMRIPCEAVIAYLNKRKRKD